MAPSDKIFIKISRDKTEYINVYAFLAFIRRGRNALYLEFV